MKVIENPLPVSTTHFVVSMMCHNFVHLLNEFQQFYAKIIWFIQNNIIKGDTDESYRAKEASKFCGEDEGQLTNEVIDVVLEKLGLMPSYCTIEKGGSRSDDKCSHCELLECTAVILEEKEASLDELDDAFAVFDENRDGYIDARKLQKVLCRLEFNEGMKLDDCEKMISAFDGNGDGRIDFYEFREMLENVV